MARITSLPKDMQHWLQQGGKVYFVWGGASSAEIIGYVRAHDRAYGQFVAKSHRGYLGRKASVTDVAGLLKLGKPELHHTVPVGTPPRRNPGQSVLDDLKAAGISIETHESDVYVPVTAESTRIIAAHGVRGVTVFRSEGRNWYDLPFQNTEFFAARARGHKQNPPLVVFGNPPGKASRGAKVLSRRAISIRYVHAADRQRYEHKFGPHDCIELLADGSVRIYNSQGKKLFGEF